MRYFLLCVTFPLCRYVARVNQALPIAECMVMFGDALKEMLGCLSNIICAKQIVSAMHLALAPGCMRILTCHANYAVKFKSPNEILCTGIKFIILYL